MSEYNLPDFSSVGIVQRPAVVLSTPTRPFVLPEEAEEARALTERLMRAAENVRQLYLSPKGLGIAAPQLGVDRRMAILWPADGEAICLLNATVVGYSDDSDVRFEGCLSFFDVRVRVRRRRSVTIHGHTLTGETVEERYVDGLARLALHELDHLDGVLLTDRMEEPGDCISYQEYRQRTDTAWTYHSR